MTSYERVKTAIQHKEPDRVPAFASFTSEMSERLRDESNVGSEDLGVRLGNDMIQVSIGIETSSSYSKEPEFMCPWGITWRNIRNQFGSYSEIVRFPLAGDEEKLSRWNIPDPTKKELYEPMKRVIDQYGKKVWIAGSCRCTLFETAWYLRGMDEFMVDLLTNEDYVNTLLDKILEYPRYALSEYIDMGADMVWVGDDVATQQGMMISPELWRKYFKPRYACLFKEFKTKNPDIIIAYHSCGNCSEIVADLIEIGLDVLHPLQPLAIDPIKVKREYGNRLTLMGGLDIQIVMPSGSPADVKAETIRLMKGCGKGGGFIIGGAHHFQKDTPIENILAFYKTVKEEGVYDKLRFEPVIPTQEALRGLEYRIREKRNKT